MLTEGDTDMPDEKYVGKRDKERSVRGKFQKAETCVQKNAAYERLHRCTDG